MPASTRRCPTTRPTTNGIRRGSGRCGSTSRPRRICRGSRGRTSSTAAGGGGSAKLRAGSPFPARGGGGRIVNVASRAAFRGDSPQHWHYAASKGALVSMTRTIARGYAADGVLCFAVAPGFTVSEMTEEYLAGRGGSKIVADIPLGRVSTTDEVAEVIRWLAIDAPASSTGSIVDVNGGSYVR